MQKVLWFCRESFRTSLLSQQTCREIVWRKISSFQFRYNSQLEIRIKPIYFWTHFDWVKCWIHIYFQWRYLDFIPGLTSTVLSELATTRTNTSPASGWFCLFKYLFTRSSMYDPSLVVCNPDQKNTELLHTATDGDKGKQEDTSRALTFSRELVFLSCFPWLLQAVVTDETVIGARDKQQL